jgi:AICAR transformylase/IMP cyclohydrolase PurH
MTDHPRRITRALLSVSDKTGLIEFAKALAGHGVELVSTGGTAKAIAAAGLQVKDVSDLTGFPEMMDGRVKTLHPKVHGGLLAIRDNKEHAGAMKAHGIAPIDLLVVNLYPFEETVDKGAGYEDCIENIDIGGPAMMSPSSSRRRTIRPCSTNSPPTRAQPRCRCAAASPQKPMRAPPLTMPQSRTGSHFSSRTTRRISAPLAAG